MGFFPIMGDRRMNFSEVDPCYLLPQRLGDCRNAVRCDGFVLHASPMDHHRLGCLPRPIEYQRSIALPIGEGEPAVCETNGSRLVLDAKVIAPSAWGMCIRVC